MKNIKKGFDVMVVKIVQIKRYELQTDKGERIGEFQVESEWHGLTRLVSVAPTKDEVIIHGSVAPGLFDMMLRSEANEFCYRDVFKVSSRISKIIEMLQSERESKQSESESVQAASEPVQAASE